MIALNYQKKDLYFLYSELDMFHQYEMVFLPCGID